MARARNIKPGFFKNADLVELTMEARLLFIGLWTLADRAGRLEDRPKQIKMELFPADSVDVDACLDGLQRWGFVARYEVAGKRLIQVVNFDKHQNPHRDEKVSALPAQDGTFDEAPKKHSASTVQAQCKDDASTVAIGLIPDSGSLIPDSGSLIPDSGSLIPDSGSLSEDSASADAPPAESGGPTIPTMAGAVCVALKASGIGLVNPSHPDLLSLLGSGVDIGAFVAAAEKAKTANKGTFAYVLGIVKGQAADSQRMAANARASPQPSTRKDRQLETAGLLTGASRPTTKPLEVIDAESRILPA